MSLHTLAHHLQSAGRGDDKVLVHMTPGEVSGLQSLALAHGGSLTINPETGLPEAGFLSGILPMIAGVALNAMVPGLGAVGSGLLVGGAGTLATGSLSKGLMMGLGAYGGAGLGAGLLGGEAAAAGLGAAGAGTAGMAPMVSAGAMPGVVGGAGALAPVAGGMTGTLAGATPGLTAATTGGGYGLPTTPTISTPVNTLNAQQAAYADYMKTNPVVSSSGAQVANAPASSVEAATSGWDKLKSMPGKAFDLLSGSGPEAEKARADFYEKNKKYLIAGGIGTLGASRDDPRIPKEDRMGPVHSYDYTRRWNPSELAPGSSSERMYYGADGGLASLPVEKMSQQNSIGENTNYPMANIHSYGYAVPKNYPVSQNVFQPESYERLDPYTGEQKLAGGGVVAFAAGGLTPQEKARKDEETAFNQKVKSYTDFGAIKEPKGGWTAANVVPAFKAALQKEFNELQYVEGRLKTYVDAKGNPKPGFDDVVNYLRDQVNDQRGQLQNAINDVYDRIPKTGIDYGDPKKAPTQKANQKNEYDAINALLPYINKSSLKGTDFGNDFLNNKFAQKLNQYTESVLYADKIVPTLAKLQDYTGKNAQGKDITGGLSALTTGWNAETARQKADVDALTTAFKTAGLMDAKGNWTPAADKYSNPTNLAKSALETQTNQYNDALGAKTSAIKDFTSSTARGETMGAHGVSAVPTPPVKPGQEKMGLDASGAIVPIVPKPKYQELGYGKTTATTGWDNTTRKPYEESDIQQVFQEVLGRKATDSEVQQYLGTPLGPPWKGQPGTMQQLVASVAAHPDAKTVRDPFTTDEIKSAGKFYLGKDLSSGELKAIADKKFTTFEGLRNYLTADPTFNKQYVDYLNKINAASFYGTPLETATKTDTTKTDTTKTDTTKTDTTKTAEGIVPGGTGSIVEAPVGKRMTAEDIAKYKQQYGGYVPSTADMLAAGTKQAAPTEEEKRQMAERAQRLYNPQYVASPLYSVPGAMAYQDVNKQLGLGNLYEKMSEKMPELQSGLKFEPSKATIAANPFANTTPGLVTLQSVATPQPYVPPSPIIPAQPAYSPALTPQEQALQQAALLASMQKQTQTMASGGMTSYNLGGYSDGGRLLKGPGDGVSDSIPASIGDRQPARLADGEFVIPARIVSEIGNGSTDAGARKLYAMMDRVQRARRKTVGQGKVAVKSGADNMLPA